MISRLKSCKTAFRRTIPLFRLSVAKGRGRVNLHPFCVPSFVEIRYNITTYVRYADRTRCRCTNTCVRVRVPTGATKLIQMTRISSLSKLRVKVQERYTHPYIYTHTHTETSAYIHNAMWCFLDAPQKMLQLAQWTHDGHLLYVHRTFLVL